MPNSEKFIDEARRRFKQASDDEVELRKCFSGDVRFAEGEQWDVKLKQDREAAGRPALVFNRLPTFIAQISNEARQNKPQIKFAPSKSGEFDQAEAEVYEGLARAIQYEYQASIAYETAFEYVVKGGFGYWRYLTEYESDETDDLVLKTVPVLDPLTVYGVLLPSCFGKKPRFAFVTEDVPLEEYKRLYPKSQVCDVGFDAARRIGGDWIGTETIRIAEYWYVEEGKKKTKTGRDVSDDKVKFCKMNGVEVLDDTETDWVGSTIPIVPVLGKQTIVDGNPILQSLIRFMRDPQQLINYGKTRIAETLATAPISPFIGGDEAFEGHEREWQTSNTTLRPYLKHKLYDSSGRLIPPPQRQTFEPPIQSLSEFVAQEVDDIKSISGIFDASLGEKSNETSGIALARRQQQSSGTNMVFMDNLERGFRQGGDIVAEAMPRVYDAARWIKIIGADEAPKVVAINQAFKDHKGVDRHYKIEASKYDIVVTVGRSYSSKRMESFDMIAEIIHANPQLFGILGDIWLRNSDAAGADEMAERLKKMLPPQLQDDSDPAGQAQQMQAKLQQTQQLLEQQHQVIAKQHDIIQTKQIEGQFDLKKAEMDNITKLAVAQINASKDANQAIADKELTILGIQDKAHERFHDAAHELAMQQHSQQFAAQQSEQQAANAQQTQASDQEHQAAMAEQANQGDSANG